MYKKWNNVKKQTPLSEICVEINVMTTPIIFSSPEHEMLRVSYSDQSLSDVRLSFHQQLLTKHLLKLRSPKKLFFFAFDFCRFCVVIWFFIPATTANELRLWRIFYPRFYPLHLFSYLNSWERATIFPFECSVLNNGTTGTIFITSLVWRGPWLGIEPGTSRTRSQHYTTRLSRRRFDLMKLHGKSSTKIQQGLEIKPQQNGRLTVLL